MKMTKPELKVVRFASEDVIATSIGIMTAAAYRGSWMNDEYTGLLHIDDSYEGYVGVQGSMRGYDSDAQGWYFDAQGAGNAYTINNIDDYKTGYLSNETYDLYLYDDGTSNTLPYTKGASYFELYGNQ